MKDQSGKDMVSKAKKEKGWLARKLSSKNYTEQILGILEEKSIWQRYGL